MENEKEWDFICVPITPLQLGIIEQFYDQTQGQQYDWVGMIASQVVPFHIKHQHRWYCSEWIAYALRLAGAVDKLYHHADLTPQRLYEMLKKYAD